LEADRRRDDAMTTNTSRRVRAGCSKKLICHISMTFQWARVKHEGNRFCPLTKRRVS
jgi:hypothetical protein